jgi:hypothetical protein
LWPECPAGRGRQGHLAQSPRGRAKPGTRASRAGVGGLAGAGSLCLFISNLIRTASSELRCLTGRRAGSHYANGIATAAAPSWTVLRFQNSRPVPCAVPFLSNPSPKYDWLGSGARSGLEGLTPEGRTLRLVGSLPCPQTSPVGSRLAGREMALGGGGRLAGGGNRLAKGGS